MTRRAKVNWTALLAEEAARRAAAPAPQPKTPQELAELQARRRTARANAAVRCNLFARRYV